MISLSVRPWHAAVISCLCMQSQAAVFSDSTLDLELKNFFYDRDYHGSDARQSRRHEWAQGVTLDWRSGWTPGALSLGVDVTGTLGLKLDSSTAQSGSGLLPRDSRGKPEPDYSTLYPTVKARWEDNDVRVGQLSPQLPLLASNGSRLFPQRFRGVQWTGKSVQGVTAHASRIDRVRLRDSSAFEEMSLTSQGGSYDSTATSSALDSLGIDWQANALVGLSLHAQRLHELMRRTYVGARLAMPLGTGELYSDLRYFDATSDGQAKAGNVDNRTFSGAIGYRWGGHGISGGVQKGWGDTAYAYINGSDTFLFGEQLVSTFGNPSERALHVRYDYNFAAMGVPGLLLNVRYVEGSDIELSSLTASRARAAYSRGTSGREWERTLDLSYTVQDGPLKDFYVRWRNGHYQSNFADPADENRLMVGYRMRLW